MINYRITNVVLDSEQIYRAMMAEYALIVAGKSEEEAPMQYAKCDLSGIFKVLYAEELGAVCSKIGGYIDNVEATTEGFTRIALRLPALAPAMLDSLLRRRMEDCIVLTPRPALPAPPPRPSLLKNEVLTFTKNSLTQAVIHACVRLKFCISSL